MRSLAIAFAGVVTIALVGCSDSSEQQLNLPELPPPVVVEEPAESGQVAQPSSEYCNTDPRYCAEISPEAP